MREAESSMRMKYEKALFIRHMPRREFFNISPGTARMNLSGEQRLRDMKKTPGNTTGREKHMAEPWNVKNEKQVTVNVGGVSINTGASEAEEIARQIAKKLEQALMLINC